jgi:endoglucanase
VTTDGSAASEVAAATAERAHGDDAKAAALLDDARRFDAQYPTYYGSAWVALGAALADSTAPLGCPAP